MKKDLTKVKTRLIELGYLDNEWLAKYLELIEANLETKKSKKSTQAHHAIPVNAYWDSTEPYNRNEALKLARADESNFEVNLLYKDHLIIHSYLTLCTDLNAVQLRYEAQEDLRKKNSTNAASGSNGQRGKLYIYKVVNGQVLNKVVFPEESPLYIEEGWSLGRKPNPTRCYIFKNDQYKNISIKQLNSYLEKGWSQGAIGKPRYKIK